MIHSQCQQILVEACKSMPWFEPTERLDIFTIGTSRYFDGFVKDKRTGKTYSIGVNEFNQNATEICGEFKAKLARLEARLTEMRDAEARNKAHKQGA